MKCRYCGKDISDESGMGQHLSNDQYCIKIRKNRFGAGPERTARERELARQLFVNPDKYKLCTHIRMDADALFSVALVRSFQQTPGKVELIEASKPIEGEYIVGLDLEEGDASIKGKEIGSCFGLLYSVLKEVKPGLSRGYEDLAKHLNGVDSGKIRYSGPTDPTFLMRNLKAGGKTDDEIIDFATAFLRGMQIRFEHEKKVFEIVQKEIKYEGYCAILVEPPDDSKAHKLVFSEGWGAYVFFSTANDSKGMGAIINSQLEKKGLSMMPLETKLPQGWLVWNNMVSWGTKRGPKDPNVSGISLEKLIELINQHIREFLNSNESIKNIKYAESKKF